MRCLFAVGDGKQILLRKKTTGTLASSGKMSTFATAKAAIAQLVEHDLAKVGVASSSLVCRSQLFDFLCLCQV